MTHKTEARVLKIPIYTQSGATAAEKKVGADKTVPKETDPQQSANKQHILSYMRDPDFQVLNGGELNYNVRSTPLWFL